jgi:3,4-dihydroxy 2-butanone 4-phosphate synthase/GTP cyclohydrolase II
MELIGRAGRGVVVVLREPSPRSVSQKIAELKNRSSDNQKDLRVYGIGAQILKALGVRDMILLSNTGRTIVGLQGYDLRVVETRPIDSEEPS